MAGAERRIPGEGLMERMEARSRRRPRIGMSPAFYTRLGLEDPWAVQGEGAERGQGNDGMVFLSAAPYHAMMEKLAASRRRRERRQAKFAERRAGTTLRAAVRSWPGEGKLPTPRIASLALDSMRLPEPPAPQVVEVEVASEGGQIRRRAPRQAEATPRAESWSTMPFVPARVIRGSAAAATHAGQRMVRAVESQEKAKTLADLPQRARSAVARSQRVNVGGAPFEPTVEIVRRTRLPRPVVRYVEEAAGVAADAPVARAARRGTPAAVGVARAPASRSPSFQMATAAHAAEVDRAAANALAAPERGEAMRPAAARRVPPTQRAAARADRQESGNSLSASPVRSSRVTAGRPLAASPVQASASAAGAGARSQPVRVAPRGVEQQDVGDLVGAAGGGPGVARAAPNAARSSSAAVARMGDAPVAAPAQGPLSRNETRLVRQASGAFSRPARTLATAETLIARPEGEPAQGAQPRRDVTTSAPPAAGRPAASSPPQAAPPSARPPASVPSAASRPRIIAQAASQVEEPPQWAAAPRTVASATRRAAQRAIAAEHRGSLLPQVVQLAPGERAPVPGQARRGAAVRISEAGFGPSSTALSLPLGLARRAPERRTPLAAPAPAGASDAAPVSPGTAAPTFIGRTTSVIGGVQPVASGSTAAPEARASHASTSRRAAERAPTAPAERESRVAAMQALPTAGWAAARGAGASPASPAPSRSALPRLTASTFTLPSFAAFDDAAFDEAAERKPVAAPARRPGVSAIPVAPAPRVTPPLTPRSVRAGSVAQAVARGGVSAPSARAASAAPASRRADPMRRSGPLSWARPAAEAELVASYASRPGRTARTFGGSAGPSPTAASPAAVLAPVRGLGSVRPSTARTPDQVLAAAPPAEVLAELSAAGLVQSSWSPSTPVRTPDGRYISARVAQRIPGLAILPTVGGPIAIASAALTRSVGLRTPDVRFVGAPSGAAAGPQAGYGAIAAPSVSRSRPTDWVSARTAVTEATAFRGAMSVRSPEATFIGAGSSTTPSGEFVGARRGRAAPGVTLRGAENAPDSVGSTPSAVGSRTSATRPRRPSLEATLADVSSAQPQADAPMWAARSDGAPQVRSAQGLFQSLARATTAEQVVNVIAARAGEMTGPVPLTEPMRAVVEQIRQELRGPAVATEGTTLRTRAPEVHAPEATVLRPSRSSPSSSGSVASSAVVRSGGSRPVRSSAVVRSPGGSDDRVSKLVKRLTDLIHLAENERRLTEAQRQVRMAEDTAAARAEGSAPVGSTAGGGAKLDIETFAREVLEVVNRELELRRERRSEDGDEQQWW